MLHVVHYVLWVLAPLIQVCLGVMMFRRQQRREFPAFFFYTVYMIVSFVLQFSLYHLSYRIYFYTYWVTGAISIGLGFAVIHEIFHHVFRPYDSLRELGNILFKWATVVLVLVAFVSAASSGGSAGPRIMTTILVLDRSVRVMQCGLVLFLFLFSGYVGLSARAHIFGIALGFGIFASVELAVVTLRAALASVGNNELSILKSATYIAACVLWLVYLRAPDPVRRKIDQPARSMEWNFTLGSVAHPAPESFLPMIESAVERVLQKREAEVHN